MLAETLARGRATLSATTDLEAAVRASGVTFVLVQTPATSPGEISLDFLRAACRGVGNAMARKASYHLVAVTSTVAPGSMEAVVRPTLETSSGKECGSDFGLCYAPEFGALGSLVDGFLHPSFVLIGQQDARAGDVLVSLHGTSFDRPVDIVRCSIAAAELAKLALNGFLATKISFANFLARICERSGGADVDEVTAILERDPRVGRGFLQGRVSFGGPCLPRDLAALKRVAESVGVDSSLASAVERINLDRLRDVERLVDDRAQALERKHGRPAVVGVLGLAFKPGSDSAEHAPGALLCEGLARLGLRVIAHDPAVRTPLTGVTRAATVAECIGEADLLVVATPWPEYAELEPQSLRRTVVIDCWRILPQAAARSAAEYLCLGVGGLFDVSTEVEPRLELAAKG
jgi:UDPglucose 6-dehydrogenase